ncbi:PREDICTED: vesicle transport protein SEC20-like [Priapulus caudatus]|uniref:Vesicle transport protein SEC20-like n=1 Tax=Priapulus caudatus TaxID=37621 RepID=A0ABM1EDV7_PRICU|nr:PREDICTED: vesicle transport protein SEC20-like [Priapulus caudatus]
MAIFTHCGSLSAKGTSENVLLQTTCTWQPEECQLKLCVQEIIKRDLKVKAAIQDIRECVGPLETLNELNLQVRGLIQDLRTNITELGKLAREQDKETDTIAILKDAEMYGKQLDGTLASLRKANLSCQLAIERQGRGNLFDEGSVWPDTRNRKRSAKEAMGNETRNITDNLQRISRMMATEVNQSDESIKALVTSSSVVSETYEEFKNQSGDLHTSKNILTKYGRRELTDKLLICLAVILFIVTVLYILRKRVFSFI